MEINLLILSAGTRNKVVQYFKKELAGRGKVYATDCSSLAPALYEADEAILVPRITEPGYLEKILSIWKGRPFMPWCWVLYIPLPENIWSLRLRCRNILKSC